jgi:hypothetical protein
LFAVTLWEIAASDNAHGPGGHFMQLQLALTFFRNNNIFCDALLSSEHKGYVLVFWWIMNWKGYWRYSPWPNLN